MSDIFLSYAREDRDKAERLAEALEGQGWSVFWDLTIPPGLTWRSHIGGELQKARCVVVAWSTPAVESRWVQEEAGEGLEREVLIPVRFEKVKPPFGFRGLQAVDLAAWTGDSEAAVFELLVKGLERLLGPVPAAQVKPALGPEGIKMPKVKRAERTALRKLGEAFIDLTDAPGAEIEDYIFVSASYGHGVWRTELEIMKDRGWVEQSGGKVRITDKGRAAVLELPRFCGHRN